MDNKIKIFDGHELFVKHFGDVGSVGIFDERIKGFFEELNQICLEEDRIKKLKEKGLRAE